MVLLVASGAFASSVQVHPPWGQDGNALFVAAFGRDRYLIVKTRTSAAINAAIDALGAEGGEVFCPEGTYTITTQVAYDADDTTIRGTTGTIFEIGADIDAVYATAKNNVKLINVEINGNNFAQTNHYLVNFDGCYNALIDGCTFYNFDNYGVNMYITSFGTRPNNGTIINSIFRSSADTSSWALTILGSSAEMCTTNVINCTFSQCDFGIYYRSGQHLIMGCSFLDNTDSAIISYNTQNNCNYGRITNCHFFQNDGYDIALQSNVPIGWTISNNTFFSNDLISVHLSGGLQHVVKGNVFSEPRGVVSCIDVDAGSSIIVDNNFKLEALDADYCLDITGGGACIVSNNTFDPDTTTGYTVRKTGAGIGNIFSGNAYYLPDYTGNEDIYTVPGPVRLGGTDYETKTDNYVVTTSDFGKTITMNSASDKTFSLPSVDAYTDGATIKLCRMSTGKVTIDAADTDYIHDSTAGAGIYTTSSYAMITLEYHHDDTRWYIKEANGTWTTY
jgi:hypothetical protein